MSLGITHFAVGMAGTVLAVWLVYPTCRYFGSLGVAGGMWALVPDLHYISPVLTEELRGIKHSMWGDIFWFHRTMDRLVQGRGSRRTASLAILLLLIVFLFVEWRNESPLWWARHRLRNTRASDSDQFRF